MPFGNAMAPTHTELICGAIVRGMTTPDAFMPDMPTTPDDRRLSLIDARRYCKWSDDTGHVVRRGLLDDARYAAGLDNPY